jgi:hypothetical protein
MFEHRVHSTGTTQIVELASKLHWVFVLAVREVFSWGGNNQRIAVDMADLWRWFKCCRTTSGLRSLYGIVKANS